jgi:hypothetical protein
MSKSESAPDVSGWSCDQRNRKACRDPHGCHCREITALRQMIDNRDYLLDQYRNLVAHLPAPPVEAKSGVVG